MCTQFDIFENRFRVLLRIYYAKMSSEVVEG